jgi:hypothetical protein
MPSESKGRFFTAGQVNKSCCNTFLCSFCARSNNRQLANKGLSSFVTIRPARPTARANLFGLNCLEEQFAGIARAVLQILNLQTRVRFPVALPIQPSCYQ